MGPAEHIKILGLIYFFKFKFIDFRFLSRCSDVVVPSGLLVTWQMCVVLLPLFPCMKASQFQLCRSKLLLFGIGYTMGLGSIPTPEVIGVLIVFKTHRFSVLYLGWLLCSSWWAPSPGCLLAGCGHGSAWSLGSVGLC